jgi:phospholipase C
MSLDKIEHIVVLMLENRSFDHMLGALSLNGRADINGLKPGMTNPDEWEVEQPIQAITNERFLTDPGHGFIDVAKQLEKGNRGFIKNYGERFPVLDKRKKYAPEIIHYQTAATVPISYRLVGEYAVCDEWFSSVPSETWPNRIFASAATTLGRLDNSLHIYDLPTVFSRLREYRREWAVYNDQLPNVLNLKHMAGEWLRTRHRPGSRFPSMDTFFADCANGRLPEYSWIEPIYFDKIAHIHIATCNDDHPPHDILEGQRLIGEVYRAIRRSPLWTKTMLIILTDEHGGFFDHQAPPNDTWVPAPDDSVSDPPFNFHQLGVRVPCIVVSPWTSRASVIRGEAKTFFDHTSLIASACRRWKMPPLTRRDAAANDLSRALDLEVPRSDDEDTLAFVENWLAESGPMTLGDEQGPAQSVTTVGLGGREVAAMFSMGPPEATPTTLGGEIAPGTEESEFQERMRALATELIRRADELEAAASIP